MNNVKKTTEGLPGAVSEQAKTEAVSEQAKPEAIYGYGSKGGATFICQHLADNPVQEWLGHLPTAEDPWPIAWCKYCDAEYKKEGGRNEKIDEMFSFRTVNKKSYESAIAASLGRLTGANLLHWNDFVSRCRDELSLKQDQFVAEYAMSERGEYHYDQATNRLVFSRNGVPAVIAKFEFIGSVSTKTNTWLWAWANLSDLPNTRTLVRAVYEFGCEMEFPHLTVPKWAATLDEAGSMAAVAVHVLNAYASYRIPYDDLCSYLVITEIRKATPDEKKAVKPSLLKKLAQKVRKSPS